MRTIWKYPLEGDRNVIRMPAGAEPLSVGWQGRPVMWATVNPEAEGEQQRVIWVLGTGHDAGQVSPLARFLGTIHQEMSGAGALVTGLDYLVLHVFDDGPS